MHTSRRLGGGGSRLTAKKSKSGGGRQGEEGHIGANTAKRRKAGMRADLLIHHCQMDGRLPVRIFAERAERKPRRLARFPPSLTEHTRLQLNFTL